MKRLLASELLRARSRRVVPMMIVGAIFGVLVGVVIGTLVIEPVREEQIVRAERRYEQRLERCLQGGFVPLERTDFATYEELCADLVEPESFLGGMKFVDLRALLDGTAMLVILLGALLGSTLGGADWSAGTMTTLLTWESRRTRVFVARALTVAAVVLVVTILAQFWLGLAFTGAVAVRGTFALTPQGYLGEVGLATVRVSAVAVCFGLIGLAFATVGRSTVSAVGAFLGYLVVVEGFVGAWVFGFAKVALGRAATAASTGIPLVIANPRPPRGATPGQSSFTLMPGRAWITLAAWTVGLCAVGVAALRARDVT